MAQYEVLRPIEYNGTLYLPKSGAEAPQKARSAGNGLEIPVDRSGVITLPESVAATFNFGQAVPIPAKAKGARDERQKTSKG
ncbi:MAG: hypothetical protein ACRD06_02475 [Terriglobia bacterium]